MFDLGSVYLDWSSLIFQLFVTLPVLLFYGFIVYFIFKVLSFMKVKLQLDRERNHKLDQLMDKWEKMK